MLHCSENHRLAKLAASMLFAGSLLLTPLFFASDAAAARGDKVYENAWACSTLYSRTPIRVQNGDDPETAICLGEGKKGRPPMSRADAWDLCKEQFDTTSQFIAWTGRGWHCRYYPR